MTTTQINRVTEISHHDHDEWCIIEQQTNGDPLQIVVNVEDIPKLIETLAATMIAQRA